MPPSSLLTFSVLPNDELVLFSEVVPPSEPVHHLGHSYRHVRGPLWLDTICQIATGQFGFWYSSYIYGEFFAMKVLLA